MASLSSCMNRASSVNFCQKSEHFEEIQLYCTGKAEKSNPFSKIFFASVRIFTYSPILYMKKDYPQDIALENVWQTLFNSAKVRYNKLEKAGRKERDGKYSCFPARKRFRFSL